MTRRLLLVALLALACRQSTAALPSDLEQRFQSEGIVRRAEDQVFRYTYYSRSTRSHRWEDRDASIIVTSRSVFVHKRGKVGLDLTPESRKANDVRRDGDRVVISSGSGQSRVSWSFRPPEDPAGWAAAIRGVVGGRDSAP